MNKYRFIEKQENDFIKKIDDKAWEELLNVANTEDVAPIYVKFKSSFVIDGRYSLIVKAVELLIDSINKEYNILYGFMPNPKGIEVLQMKLLDECGSQIKEIKLEREKSIVLYYNQKNGSLIVRQE